MRCCMDRLRSSLLIKSILQNSTHINRGRRHSIVHIVVHLMRHKWTKLVEKQSFTQKLLLNIDREYCCFTQSLLELMFSCT